MFIPHSFRSLCGRVSPVLFLLAVTFLPLFTSCQSAADEAVPTNGEDGLCTVNFTVSNYQQISFDDLSGGASTRATAVPTNHPSTLAHLIVAVFDAESGKSAIAPIQHDYADYETMPENYPLFSVTLSPGKYRVVILGYNGSRACQIASAKQISWADGYVPHTFLYSEELTVDKNTAPDQKISLRRVVSAFRVTAEDAVPAELRKMRFASTAGGTVLDATTGFTPQSTGYDYDISVPNTYTGVENLDFTVYLFLTGQEMKTDYTVQALGTSDKVLYEKHFADVPLRINTLSTWKGEMFKDTPVDEPQTMGFNIEWDTQWTDTIWVNAK